MIFYFEDFLSPILQLLNFPLHWTIHPRQQAAAKKKFKFYDLEYVSAINAYNDSPFLMSHPKMMNSDHCPPP